MVATAVLLLAYVINVFTVLDAPGLRSVAEYVFVPSALNVMVGGVTVKVCETGAGNE
jgi:hypothetical protein